MFRKTLALVLFGILAIGAATVAYGTFFDKGFAASVAAVAGSEEGKRHDGHDRDHERAGKDHRGEHDDHEDDDDEDDD